MSSFEVKNILKKDIITTYDVCPQFSYTHLPSDDVVKSRISQNDAMIIKGCMKQHLMIFAPNEPVFCKECLFSCNACLRFNFKECLEENIPVYAELPCNDYFGDDREIDAIDETEKIFDFLDIPLFVSLFNGNQNEPLYFVKVTEKDTAQKDLTDPYGHSTGNGERFLKEFYLKLSRSKHISMKNFN